jgi:hypothetical protein
VASQLVASRVVLSSMEADRNDESVYFVASCKEHIVIKNCDECAGKCNDKAQFPLFLSPMP